MKLLINAQPLLEPAGGLRTYVAQLLRVLKSEPEIEELLLSVGGRIRPAIADPSCQFVPADRESRILRMARRLPAPVKRLARDVQLRAAVRHLPGFLYHEPNHLLQPWPLRRVLTVHDLTCLTLPQFHPEERIRMFEHRLGSSVTRADAVITVSQTVRQQIIDAFDVDPQRVYAIPLGVSTTAVEEARQARILTALDITGRFFLAVGTVEPRKNIALIAAAAEALWRAGNPVAVVHVGPTGWKQEGISEQIRRLTDAGLWRALGVVDDATLSTLYTRSIGLLFPSFDEGFGLPPVEAMANGAPAIVSDIPVHREVLGAAPLYCDPRSVESLMSQMQLLRDDADLARRHVELGRETAARYTWEATAARTLDVYRPEAGSTG